MNTIEQLEAEQITKLTAERGVPEFGPGDTVRVHYKVVEGLGPTLYNSQMSDAELKLRVMEMLEWALERHC